MLISRFAGCFKCYFWLILPCIMFGHGGHVGTWTCWIRGHFSLAISGRSWGLMLGCKLHPNMMYLLLKGWLEMWYSYWDIWVRKFEVKGIPPYWFAQFSVTKNSHDDIITAHVWIYNEARIPMQGTRRAPRRADNKFKIHQKYALNEAMTEKLPYT